MLASEKSQYLFGVAGLILVTMIWGSSFAFMKTSLTYISPMWFLAVRFALAALAVAALLGKKAFRIDRAILRAGFILSLLLAASYTLQTYGLVFTTASNNAFITTTYVVFVPLLGWFFTRRLRPAQVIVGFATLFALAVFSFNSQLQMAVGDIYTLFCAILYALHIIVLGRVANTLDNLKLTLVQIACAAVVFFIVALVSEPLPRAESFPPQVWGTLLYTAVASTAFALMMQTKAQKVLPPAAASVLMTGEALFGALFGWLLLDELMSARQLIGAAALLACMISAVLIKERNPREITLPERSARK